MKHIRIFIVAMLLCGSQNIDAQGVYKQLPDLPFLKPDSNFIQFPGHPGAFDLLFKKLDKLIFHGKGQINIVHIGGSHIQADIISHKFRNHLLNIQPGLVTGRGLIFPYSIAKTNNPWNYKTTFKGKWTAVRNVQRDIKADLGVSGIAVLTSDSTSEFTIEMRKSDFPAFEFHRIKIMCTGDTCGVEPVLLYNNLKLNKTEYDTLNNTYIFHLPLNVCEFTVGFKGFTSDNQSIGITGILLENDKPGIIYHSIGINGASVPSFLQCIHFQRDLAMLNPDLIIFALGINDANSLNFSPAAFEANYNELITKVRNVNPYATLLFSVNNDTYRKSGRRYVINENNALARNIFFKLAQKHTGGVWDLYTIMGGRGSMEDWEKVGLAKIDKIHFTGPGYELLGDMLFNAFWSAYTDYVKTTIKKQKSKQ
jgi:lysophospholipase L1-like esterase